MAKDKINTLNDIPAIRDYLDRIGAEVRSLKTAVVKEISGAYWRDLAVITFGRDGKVKAPEAYAPTPAELAAIEKAVLETTWPQLKPLARLSGNLPEDIKNADPRNVFEFRDLGDKILMVQVRKDAVGGHRSAYIPYTYWDDNEWRRMEPEGPLPLWGIDQLKEHTTVFLHEGAKAAAHCRWLIEGKSIEAKEAFAEHPWAEELSAAAHLGWIGGALTPHRTDWSVLNRAGVKRAYIVSDNDEPGKAAVPHISFHLKVPTFHVQFTEEWWPGGFDLADEWPEKCFSLLEGKRYYIGPNFKDVIHPATWATDQVPNPKGKPTIKLRDNFKEMWAYVEEADMFVCIEMPEIIRPEAVANKMLSGFSHTPNTTQLIVKNYHGRTTKLCYRPDLRGRIVTDRNTAAVNLHTPTHIKSAQGNAAPFLDFMDYMFPNEQERHEVLRWCATLIAYPEVRMEYGLLLVSETQGIGKTTLGSIILAPLVGLNNVGYPGESDIVNSDFNEWLANKRLVIVNEIYSGHSWKAYNRLKTFITDPEVTVNKKYQRPYVVENWCHIFACSNSLRALRMEEDDRRWFYPEVSESRWPREKFVNFYRWIQNGGLGIIKHWAEGFSDTVLKGQRAPMTARKRELIEGSRSDAQKEVADLASALCNFPEPVGLAMKAVEAWVRSSVEGKIFDSDYELRKTMREAGAKIFKKRVKIGGRMQYVIGNEALVSLINGHDDDEAFKIVRERLRQPTDLLNAAF